MSKEIGKNIKKYRILAELEQAELAEKLFVAPSTVSSWEVGRTEPKMGMIEKICQILHCSKLDIIETKEPQYYINDKTAEIAQKIFDNKELSLLFESASDADPEDLKTVHQMLLALKRKEN